MSAKKRANVDLGFIEETQPWRLYSHLFPSKVGGKPAWLCLDPLPDSLKCNVCGKTCIFLLQVYAPDESKSTCFHRTIYIFICRSSDCFSVNESSNFIVLRSQLPRQNRFYSADPPDEDNFDETTVYPNANQFHSLCIVCGWLGAKTCSQCKTAKYCSKEHQTLHWKGGHKEFCKQGNVSQESISAETLLKCNFPEYELAIEPEEYQETAEKTEDKRLAEYSEYVKSTQFTELEGKRDDDDLRKMAASTEDKAFMRFRERISHKQDQVLRYEVGGKPLWVSDECVPNEKDIPTCKCGAPRRFEFQVLPQLLNHLKCDATEAVDWGTLAVYTCSMNCDEGAAYKQEFLWKQDFSVQSNESKG